MKLRLLKTWARAYASLAALLWIAFSNGALGDDAQTYSFTTIAGRAGVSGSADGTNSRALFDMPSNLALDSSGNLFVSDRGNSTIRMIVRTGSNWVVSTIAGQAGKPGVADGTNGVARFNSPSGVAVDGNGNVYVADSENNTIRRMTRAGTDWVVTTIAHGFNQPQGPIVDGGGNVYVADRQSNLIRKIAPVGNNWVVSTIAGRVPFEGSADGTNGTARFSIPSGVAADTMGNLYVTDQGNNTIRKIIPIGTNWVVSTIAGDAGYSGSADGANSYARFNFPGGLTVDTNGNIYVADLFNNTLRKVSPTGANWMVTTIGGFAGVGGAGAMDGTGSTARFNSPNAVALDAADNLYVADFGNNTIRLGTPLSLVTGLGWNSNAFSFDLIGLPGQTLVTEVSTDLSTWTPLQTNTINNGTLRISDPASDTIPWRFYRARQQ